MLSTAVVIGALRVNSINANKYTVLAPEMAFSFYQKVHVFIFFLFLHKKKDKL